MKKRALYLSERKMKLLHREPLDDLTERLGEQTKMLCSVCTALNRDFR